MSKLLGLADIRDWIKSLNYTASENCYICLLYTSDAADEL